ASVAARGDAYFVEAGGSLSATGEGANGIHAPSGDLAVSVLGSVSARHWGIYAAGWDSNINVGASGSVYGEERGIFVAGDPFTFHNLKNSGIVGGKDEGVRFHGYVLDVFNDGTIFGQKGTALTFELIADATGVRGYTRLVNSGSILGGGVGSQTAIMGSQGRDLITNRGTITGDVKLGDGDDTFDNREGTLISGVIDVGSGANTVWSGNGNDSINAGIGDDFIDAGTGQDVINWFGASGITLNLANAARQDTGVGFKTILNVENATAGGAGNHRLTGNAGDNVLTTNLGNDTLDGGFGNDTVNGNGGLDTALYSGDIGAIVDLTLQRQAQNTNYGLDTLLN
ncbi:calcium-binding protein, partial [Streptomyces albidoflavus]|uniref:calcium-binding protein n=1 Tax=Streptomyces albidoflavus TaxID=1886 RepID=UPI003444AE17